MKIEEVREKVVHKWKYNGGGGRRRKKNEVD